MTNRDDQLESLGKSIIGVLTSGGLDVTKAAISGSVAKQSTTSKSDVDVIYAIRGDPSNNTVDPKVVTLLKHNFPNYNPRRGSGQNVVKLDVPNFGHADIKLKTSTGFDHELRHNRHYRRLHLS